MEAAIQFDSFNNSSPICSSGFLDISIQDAVNKKKNVDSKLDSIISLLGEVECREKAAEKAKEEAYAHSLDILAEIDELKYMQNRAKETNDLRAQEVSGQKAALATEMEKLQFRLSILLNDGDESLDVLDEMRKSLEKRLSSAIIRKKAADIENLEKEMALSYQKRQMEKVEQESKRLEQQAIENLKLQEFLLHRGHVIDTLREEISCKCHVVNLINEALELYEYPDEYPLLNTENPLKPIIQELIEKGKCQCTKCTDLKKGVKGRFAVSKKEMKQNKMRKSSMKNSMNKETRNWIEEQIMEGVTDDELKDNHDLYRDMMDRYIDIYGMLEATDTIN